jgi:DNA-binding HxlR family transcriptional regulator
MVQRTRPRTPPSGKGSFRSTAIVAVQALDSDSALRRVGEINVFNVECPAHQVVARVGNKWTLLVLYALSQGTKRYTELQNQIGRISPKMLTQVLRNLEKDRLVSRKVHPVVPPMVEYSLTPLGLSLAKPLAGLCVWAEDNYSLIRETWHL